MQPYFRDAVASDVAEIARLLRAASPDDEPDTGDDTGGRRRVVDLYLDALAEIDRTPGVYVLVAEYGGAVAGMVQLITYRQLRHHGGRCADIESLHIAAEHRTTGLAGMLLDRAVRRARELGCHRVQVSINAGADDLRRLYERQGFVGTHRSYRLALEP